MITNIQSKRKYETKAYPVVISWEYKGISNTIECWDWQDSKDITMKLISSQTENVNTKTIIKYKGRVKYEV